MNVNCLHKRDRLLCVHFLDHARELCGDDHKPVNRQKVPLYIKSNWLRVGGWLFLTLIAFV